MRVSTLSGPYGLFPGRKRFGGLRVHETAGYSDLLPSFWVPFADLGAGVVSLTEIRTNATPTFTRATTAWTRLSTGLWASVASGSPRSFYDASGGYRGYISETSRTNICIQSRDLSNAAWVSGGGGVVGAKTQTGIDGVVNSCSLMTASGADGTLLQSITSASATRVFSAWVKRSVGAGTIEMTVDGGTGWTDVTSQLISGQFALLQMTQAAVTNPSVGFRIHTSGDAFIIDMCQVEGSTAASTPIPTTTVSVTRNGDVLTYPLTTISNTAGTAYSEVYLFGVVSATKNQFTIGQTGASTGRVLFRAPGVSNFRINDGTTTLSSNTITIAMNTAIKCASSWGTNLAITANNTTPTTATFDGNMGLTTTLEIGSHQGDDQLLGGQRNIKIFNRQVSLSQLQAMTV